MRTYLTSAYGKSSVSATASGDAGVKTHPFLNIKGIIGMKVTGWSDATGHFTLWDGRAFADGHEDHLTKSSEVWLWKAA